ncbi:hypothetical protein [Reinekea sp. G2M2-21]|uniref:hypothetical protein n=1 Tax=Reinekea sp. G2M2-21 TaxID=2788942 RepID=UPI0018AC1157|nr:hypothetical protein [Reinekea sp. G2M2-21]
MKQILIAFFGFALVSGCVTNIPVSSSPNEFVMLQTKMVNDVTVSHEYVSEVQDGEIRIVDPKDGRDVSGLMLNSTQGTTFGRMINDHFQNKFMKLQESGGEVQIRVFLKDFYVERAQTDTAGEVLLKAFVTGGAVDYQYTAINQVLIEVERDGETLSKMIKASSVADGAYGETKQMLGSAIDKSNSKTLMLMNAYFEEIGL